jgi:hypothetical protein
VIDNLDRGITAISQLVVERSRVERNFGGGIECAGGCTITNNFIAENGSALSQKGGLYVRDENVNYIEHNTIIRNEMSSSGMDVYSGGLFCRDAAHVASNNIICLNVLGTTTDPAAQVAGGCAVASSHVSSECAGINFVRLDLPSADYHLAAGINGAVDVGTASAIATDLDGEARPNGTGPDLGADERYP